MISEKQNGCQSAIFDLNSILNTLVLQVMILSTIVMSIG